ncbi:hypothetical protein ACFLUD_03415 [Chloroflexota bacterium]
MDDLIFQHEGLVFDHAEGKFETLHEFLSLSAENLLKEHAEYVDFHNKQQKNYPLILDDLYNEDYTDFYLTGLGKYGNTFPRMLLYSIMIMACSLFESNIKLTYKVMNHFSATKLKWDDLRGTVVDKTIKLLKDIGLNVKDEKETMEKFRNYHMIRNCIVHNNGEIQEYRYKDKLLKYANELGLVSSAYDEPILELTRDYCNEVCDDFMFFFSGLSINYSSRRKNK